jgi:Tfp pilus assembly protein PilX
MAPLAAEGGQTVVIVLLLLVIALGLAAAGVAETLSSNQLTNTDARARRAQQAADAGVQAQLYQQSEADLGSTAYNLNGGLIGTGTFLDCFVPKLSVSLQVTGIVGVAANATGVCPQAQSSTGSSTTDVAALGNHTFYQSEMLTGQTNFLNGTTISSQNGGAMRELFPKIVSIGSETSSDPGDSGTVYSREEAILAPIEPLQVLEGENSVTINGLSVCIIILGCSNLTGTLNGDVMSRGNLTTPSAFVGLNLSNGLLATLAYGGSLTGGLTIANVQHVSPSSIIQRQAVTISSTKPDCPTAGCPTGYTGTTGTNAHNFSITSGSVTFPTGDYVFCNFNAAAGTTVNISPPVRIFVDSPSSTRCSADSSPKGNFTDPAGFVNGLLGTGGVLASSGMQVYVAGDGTGGDTTVQIGPTSTSGLLTLGALTYGAIVYAPTSNVTVNVPAACVSLLVSACTGGIFEGAIVGYNTTVTALTITQDLDIGNYPLYAGVNAFRPVQYVQCDNSLKTLTQSTSDVNGC